MNRRAFSIIELVIVAVIGLIISALIFANQKPKTAEQAPEVNDIRFTWRKEPGSWTDSYDVWVLIDNANHHSYICVRHGDYIAMTPMLPPSP